MRIAALALAVACGSATTEPSEPSAPSLPDGPSCERVYAALEISLAELHHQAGRSVPTLPDRTTWIATCRGLSLSDEQLACLEPEVASAEPTRCVQVLDEVDRTPIDQPFLTTLLTQEAE